MSNRSRSRAFTLVELLVVIGIIGALIAILLPVLSGVQSRGRDIKCQSNVRQIVQGMMMYAAENKGAMPYGLYWVKSDPATWEPASGDWNDPYITWVSLTSAYMGKRSGGMTRVDEDLSKSVSPAFQCPEALQAFAHPVSYAANMIVAVAPVYELWVGQIPNAQLRPPLVTQMVKGGTALVWDTAIQPNWGNSEGFLTGADIDGQRFWDGADAPQLRYFSQADPFGQLPPGIYGNNKPVSLNVGSLVFTNIDPRANSNYPWQGNLRFRHNKASACNIGFSDGSVGQFTAKVRRNNTVERHDALRWRFMIKYPTGVIPDPNLPS